MATVQRLLLVFELVILFGPVTILLFMAPIGLLSIAHTGLLAFLFTVVVTLLGGFALYVCMNLAAHAFDRDHPVPSARRVVSAWVAAVLAFLITAYSIDLEPLTMLTITLPVVGGAHLTYRCRRSIMRNGDTL